MALSEAVESGGEHSGRGLLDLAALAGAQTVGAAAAVIAVGDGAGWWVRGCSGTRADVWRGSRLSGVDTIPRGVVVGITAERRPDGLLQLGVGDGGHPDHQPLAARHVLLGEPVHGWSVLVLLEQPTEQSPLVVERCLRELRGAAEDALSAELEGERVRLRAGLQEREEERRRWARELHDETLQQLGALQVLLTSARRAAGQEGQRDDTDGLAQAVDLATKLLAGQITSLRHLITELRPAALDELGLRAPLQALAARTEALTDLKVNVHVSLRYADGEVTTRLVPDIEVAVYRVVQEALTNVSRHAMARQAWVSVVESDGQVRVEVSDDGTWFDQENASGFGLRGMRERAALAGGRLEVHPAEGERDPGEGPSGTVIRLVVPATHRSGDGDQA